MKRIIPFILLLAISGGVQAQLFKKKEKRPAEIYAEGRVPVVNNKVTFCDTIKAEGLSAAQIETIAKEWFAQRFVKPTVIGFNLYDQEEEGTLIAKDEEYIVFKKRFFVLNRSRITYFLTITSTDGRCIFNMSRITYWWDDEAEDGGFKLKAEECITDNASIDQKGRLRKFEGRFRTKTIDLKETLLQDLKTRLTINK